MCHAASVLRFTHREANLHIQLFASQRQTDGKWGGEKKPRARLREAESESERKRESKREKLFEGLHRGELIRMKKKRRGDRVSSLLSALRSPENSFTISQSPEQSLRTQLSKASERTRECARESEGAQDAKIKNAKRDRRAGVVGEMTGESVLCVCLCRFFVCLRTLLR